jgi:hypothetical protein
MHGRSQHHIPSTGGLVAGNAPPRPTSRGAVAWINHARALVARRSDAGVPVVTEVIRDPLAPDDDPTFLARVTDRIGDAERIVILGPGDMRTRLEREHVMIWHRPDRIVDVEPSGPVTREQLLERLARMIG